jgi:hypothetical protein
MTPTQTFGTSNPVHRLTVQHCTEALWKMTQTGLRALENYGGGHLEAKVGFCRIKVTCFVLPEVGPAFQRCDQSGKSDIRPSVVGGDNRLILTLLTADTSR